MEPDEPQTDPAHEEHPQHGHQHHFDDPAQYATAWESPERDAWQQPAVLVAHMDIAPGMRVADVGTGTGYLLRYLSAAVGPSGRVVAIDVERAMVDWVAERARTSGWTNVEPLLAPPTGPGVPDGSLDRAVMVNVYHHIEHREHYARNLLRALVPGGSVLIVETRLDAPDGPPMHFRLPEERVMEELRRAGFDVTLSPYGNVRQYAVLGTRPDR
ncbi:MAG: methyltransferase domain-containing protein [Polyangiales bacterium]|nr:methyltransferase domain-containing protein [Myxococcales bacterium]MCB9659321.1 methyltransferase domain-containing protein [Sandaracinaceae bacterium]